MPVKEWLLEFKDGITTEANYSCVYLCSKIKFCDVHAFCESPVRLSEIKTRFCDIVNHEAAISIYKLDDEEKRRLVIAKLDKVNNFIFNPIHLGKWLTWFEAWGYVYEAFDIVKDLLGISLCAYYFVSNSFMSSKFVTQYKPIWD